MYHMSDLIAFTRRMEGKGSITGPGFHAVGKNVITSRVAKTFRDAKVSSQAAAVAKRVAKLKRWDASYLVQSAYDAVGSEEFFSSFKSAVGWEIPPEAFRRAAEAGKEQLQSHASVAGYLRDALVVSFPYAEDVAEASFTRDFIDLLGACAATCILWASWQASEAKALPWEEFVKLREAEAKRAGSQRLSLEEFLSLHEGEVHPLGRVLTALAVLSPGTGSDEWLANTLGALPLEVSSLVSKSDPLRPSQPPWEVLKEAAGKLTVPLRVPLASPLKDPTAYKSKSEEKDASEDVARGRLAIATIDCEVYKSIVALINAKFPPAPVRQAGATAPEGPPQRGQSNPWPRWSDVQKIVWGLTKTEKGFEEAQRLKSKQCLQCGSTSHRMGDSKCKKSSAVKPFFSQYSKLQADEVEAAMERTAESRNRASQGGAAGSSRERTAALEEGVEARRVPALDRNQDSRIVQVRGKPVCMSEDSGGDFCIIRLDQTAGFVVLPPGQDPDLDELLSLGVVGSDGNKLSLPVGVVDLTKCRDLATGKSFDCKFFVFDGEELPPFVLGRNVLRVLRGLPQRSAVKQTGEFISLVNNQGRQDKSFRAAMGNVSNLKHRLKGEVSKLRAETEDGKGSALRKKLASLMADKLERAGSIKGAEFEVQLLPGAKSEGPPAIPPIRVRSWQEMEAIREFLREGLRMKLVRRSSSPGNNRLVVVNQDGKWRVCLDLTAVNKRTRDEVQLIPRVEEALERLRKDKPALASVLDMVKGYWQVKLHPESKRWCAFSVDGEHFEFDGGSPFGLKGLPAYFNKLVKEMLDQEGLSAFSFNIFDDIIVWGSEADHDERVTRVVSALARRGVVLSFTKADLRKRDLVFAGRRIRLTKDGPVVSISPKSVDKLRKLRIPETREEMRSVTSFLAGLIRHCPGLEERRAYFKDKLWAIPSGQRMEWSPADIQQWEEMLAEAIESPAVRVIDPSARCIGFSDAGKRAEMFLLYQGKLVTSRVGKETVVDWEKSELYLVECRSRVFTDGAQDNWGIWKKETHALYWGVCEEFADVFRYPSKDGLRHVALTDSTVARALLDSDPDEEIIRRWMSALSECAVDILWTRSDKNPSDVGTRRLLGHGVAKGGLRNALLGPQSKAKMVGVIRHAGAYSSGPRVSREQVVAAHGINHEGVHRTVFRWQMMQGITCLPTETKKEARAMAAEVKRSCLWCQQHDRHGAIAPPLRPMDVGSRPFESVSMDLKVFNKPDRAGFQFILVVPERHTKFTVVVPLRSKKRAAVIKALKQQVIGYFGIWDFRLSDNGPEFELDKLLEGWEKSRIRILPYEPQGNGPSERTMRELNHWLKTLSPEQYKEWSAHVWEFMLKLNSALFEGFGDGVSRAKALLGFQPTLPEVWTDVAKRGDVVSEARVPYMETYKAKQLEMEAAFNKRTGAEEVSLVPGDKVLVEARDPKPHGPAFEGPASVVSVNLERNSAVVSTVNERGEGAVQERHLRRLKKLVEPVTAEPGESPELKRELVFDDDEGLVGVDEQHEVNDDHLADDRGRLSDEDKKAVNLARQRLLGADTSGRPKRGMGDMLGVDFHDPTQIKRIDGHEVRDGKLMVHISEWTTGHQGNVGEWRPVTTTSSAIVEPLREYVSTLDEL